MSREFDVQSLQSDSVASSTLTNGSTSIAQGTTVEMLRELVKKRIITLTYLRNVHEGYVVMQLHCCCHSLNAFTDEVIGFTLS